MKIYIVLWDDRHTNTLATLFTDLDKAKKWAREQAEDMGQKWPDDIIEKDYGKPEWLYYIEYSCEGDCLWITEQELEAKNG